MKKRENYEKKRNKRLKILGLGVIIVFLLLIIIPTALELPEELKEPEPPEPPVPKVNLDKDQIFPVLLTDTYNPQTGKVGMTFKLYITNVYREPVKDVKVELMILRNLTIREEQMQSVGTINAKTTEVVWFNNVDVRPGEYYAHFVLWQDGKVTGKVDIYFGVNKDDIQETSPPPSDGPTPDPSSVDDDDDEDAFPSMGLSGDSSLLCAGVLFILIVLIVVVVVVVLILQRKQQVSGKRKEVLEYIRQHPGANFNKIKKRTDSGAGSTDYNIKKLQEQQMIYSKEDGQYKRFFDSTVPFQGTPAEAEASTKERIHRMIKDNPEGVTSAEMIELLAQSKQVVSYNLNQLVNEDKITTKEEDGKILYIPVSDDDEE